MAVFFLFLQKVQTQIRNIEKIVRHKPVYVMISFTFVSLLASVTMTLMVAMRVVDFQQLYGAESLLRRRRMWSLLIESINTRPRVFRLIVSGFKTIVLFRHRIKAFDFSPPFGHAKIRCLLTGSKRTRRIIIGGSFGLDL